MSNFLINGMIPIYWDIETSGLCATEDEFGLAVFLNGVNNEKEVITNLEDLHLFLSKYFDNKAILVGFNTGNFKGGFDLPFLRYHFIKQGLDWPFKGINHLDISPLVESHINTMYSEVKIPSQSSLYKADLQELAFENGVQYTTVKDTYNVLLEMHEEDGINWMDRDSIVNKTDNSLQYTYQVLFDPNCQEVYIPGEDMVKYIENDNWDPVIEHCSNDVVRLRDITEALIPTIPDYYIQRNIVLL